MDILKRIYRQRLSEVCTDIHRSLYYDIDWNQPLIGIKGQRGVGKTTMMLQRIKETDPSGNKSFYASLDNIWFAEHNLLELAATLADDDVEHLYLDEVHRLPGWERQIKNVSDSFPNMKLIFTGSSLLLIDNAIGDLSRRVSMHILPGLSFREFLHFEGIGEFPIITLQDVLYSHDTIAPSISSQVNVLKQFSRYMKRGYYPFYLTMNENDYYSRIAQMVAAVIDYDIPATEKRIEYETLIKAKRLISIIAGAQPYEPNLTTLAGVMGTNRSQLLRLLELLDKAALIRQIFPNAQNPRSLSKPNKILMNNSTLMQALDCPQIGTERECTFASFVSLNHTVNFAKKGDFLIDRRYLFEIGGRKKGFSQIKDIPDSFVVADNIEFGFGNKIPLWLFGFLY